MKYAQLLLMTVAGVAISGVAPAAWAQSRPVQSATVEEIVVTAQRREESLQDVPISVSAITAAAAERQGITGTALLQTSVPGLDMSRQANGSTPFLRGIGATSSAVGNEPSVATYVDGVYIASTQASIFEFNNIERIEVLRGPQGTLFGRNASGGVISIVTRDPTFEPALTAKVGYANYDTWSGAFYGSTRLSDAVAVNLAAYGSKQNDGWGRNIVLNQDLFRGEDAGVRGKLLYQPTEATRVLLSADFNHSRTDQGVNLIIAPGAVGIDGATFKGHYNGQSEFINVSRLKQYGTSLRIEQDMGWASVVSISAYRRFNGGFHFDQDGTPTKAIDADINQSGRSYSQELQLLSPKDSALNWIIGGFYFNDRAAYDPLDLRGIVAIDSYQTVRSLAGFGQATYEVLPGTELTAGLRYTSDRRGVNGRLLAGGAVIPGTAATDKQTFNKLTYRLSLNHKFTDDVAVYASYNRGFKSGTYNLLSFTAPPVRPEIVDSFEVGLKSDLFDRRLRLNGSAFYYDYQDIQVDQIVAGAVFSVNAAKAEIYGGELELTAVPTDNLEITAGLSVLHGRYKVFPGGPFFQPAPGVCDGNPAVPGNQPVTTGPRFGGNIECGVDLSGYTTVHTPKTTFNAAVNYRIPMTSGELALNASLYVNSGFFWDPGNRIKQKPYELVNTSARFSPTDSRFTVIVWAKNLFDQYYSSFSGTQSLADTETPAPPRTFGVTLEYAL